ncbi:NADPH-dependent oxidoreductase [Pedobacter frigiditerrae]|uniref:NADPH-dependent oxidoreductase n=1 Tax=Pedobacter frigiditerrae TaxID=2530452 RepID=A0A4R0MJQ7_9SPHI|nr:NAD(P)H-dependent oxidoreductase [Pedobacter frigiditerrae]TCC86643.1 NADPH-dependent oxidoreductase [Pedobacter frigiditerrae]
MITIIAGTNRPNSNTLKVAKFYQNQLAEKGLKTELLDLQDLPETLIGTDLYGKRSEAFSKIQDLVTKTEKFLFVIPEYNGSFPGVLKTFIDACSFPESFYDKKACLVGISSGKYGNIRGIEHFNGVCAYLHLNVMPLRLHISDIKTELNENAQLTKEDTLKFVNQQMDKFAVY